MKKEKVQLEQQRTNMITQIVSSTDNVNIVNGHGGENNDSNKSVHFSPSTNTTPVKLTPTTATTTAADVVVDTTVFHTELSTIPESPSDMSTAATTVSTSATATAPSLTIPPPATTANTSTAASSTTPTTAPPLSPPKSATKTRSFRKSSDASSAPGLSATSVASLEKKSSTNSILKKGGKLNNSTNKILIRTHSMNNKTGEVDPFDDFGATTTTTSGMMSPTAEEPLNSPGFQDEAVVPFDVDFPNDDLFGPTSTTDSKTSNGSTSSSTTTTGVSFSSDGFTSSASNNNVPSSATDMGFEKNPFDEPFDASFDTNNTKPGRPSAGFEFEDVFQSDSAKVFDTTATEMMTTTIESSAENKSAHSVHFTPSTKTIGAAGGGSDFDSNSDNDGFAATGGDGFGATGGDGFAATGGDGFGATSTTNSTVAGETTSGIAGAGIQDGFGSLSAAGFDKNPFDEPIDFDAFGTSGSGSNTGGNGVGISPFDAFGSFGDDAAAVFESSATAASNTNPNAGFDEW